MPSWKNWKNESIKSDKIFKSFKSFLKGFKPSKYSFLLFIIFFIGGFLFAFMDPQKAQSTFYGGFLLHDLVAEIIPPTELSFQYLLNQFVYFLGRTSWDIFYNNLMVSLECIFSGFLIIPIILVNLFGFLGSATYLLILKMGIIKGPVLLLGSFHIIFEYLAAILVIDAFLSFYGALTGSIRQKSFTPFKKGMINYFIPLLMRIIILLLIAAFLEVFWSTWWVYILTHPYISWTDFYTGVYSCVVP